VSGSPTGSKSPPTRRPLSPKPPPPEPSGHHQDSAIALESRDDSSQCTIRKRLAKVREVRERVRQRAVECRDFDRRRRSSDELSLSAPSNL
jgi:hypothetical protein